MMAREARIQRLGQTLGVAEGIADTLRGRWILVIARVSYQRPARSVGLAEEVGHVGGSDEALLTLAIMHALRQVWRLFNRLQIVTFDIGAIGGKLAMRPTDTNHRQTIVGGYGPGGAMRTKMDLKAL